METIINETGDYAEDITARIGQGKNEFNKMEKIPLCGRDNTIGLKKAY